MSEHPQTVRVSKKKGIGALAVVVVLGVAAVAAPWFTAPGYLFFTDFNWGPHKIVSWQNFGAPLLWAMTAVGTVFGAAPVEKTVIAASLALLVIAGMRLAGAFSQDVKVRALVGLYFLFNPFVYERLGYGQLNMLFALGFFTLGAAELLSATVGEPHGRFVLWTALWFGLALQFSPHFLFFILAVSLVCIVPLARKELLRSKKSFVLLAGAAAIIGALNANAIAAALFGTGAVTEGFSHADLGAFKTSGATGWQALKNVLMLSGFWGKDQMRFFDLTAMKESWGRSFIVLLPLIILGAVVGWRDKKRHALTVGLLVAFAVSVTLAVGISAAGAREVTFWLFDHVPLYKGLRETQKWTAVALLTYGIFLAWGLERLYATAFVKARTGIATALLGAVVLLQAPAMLWGLSGVVLPHEYPADWAVADEYLVRHGCDGDTLVLPWHLYVGMPWTKAVTANPSPQYFRCSTVIGTNMEWGGIYDNSGDARGGAVEKWLVAKGDDGLLRGGAYRLRHVMLQKDADWKAYAWLDALTELRMVQDTENIRLYEVIEKK